MLREKIKNFGSEKNRFSYLYRTSINTVLTNSFAFMVGQISWRSVGLLHFEIEKWDLPGELGLRFIGFDKVTHRFRVNSFFNSCTISGGLHIGVIALRWCCVLAFNVSVSP